MMRVLPLTLLLVVLSLALLAGVALADTLEDGQTALQEKRYDDAVTLFRKALGQKAKAADATIGLTQALIGAGAADGYGEAMDLLHKAIEKSAKRRDLKHALGDLYLATAKSMTDDTQTMKFMYEDAKTTFTDLLKEDPADEAAAVGLARALYECADFDGAIGILDVFLEKNKDAGKVWFWKGQATYLKALDAYRQAGKVDEAAKTLFGQAAGAYMAATKLDPEDYEGWLQLGYAAQYGGDTAGAQEAYEKAMDLDAQSMLPLKGIEALYFYRKAEYPKALATLAETHPDNVALHFYRGFNQLQQKDYDGAIESFETYGKASTNPGFAWVHLAKAYDGKGDDDKARACYGKALAANPNDLVAAEGLDSRLRNEYRTSAAGSPKTALEMANAYEDLFKQAPDNVWVRNNAAFILREAVTPQGNSAAWRPVLETCVKMYEEASAIAERHLEGREASTPYATRHGYAGVINDTALMFQYYPTLLDLEKAEEYYSRALDLTKDGYYDAFTNLAKIYAAAGRWDDLYELAESCAESLKNVDGSNHSTGRAHARGVAQQLIQEGKVER